MLLLNVIIIIKIIMICFNLFRSRRIYKLGYKYELEVEKITTTYDSIIVNNPMLSTLRFLFFK